MESKDIKSYALYRFAACIIRPIINPLFRIRYIGLENVPREGKIIIASNHISFLDPPAIGAGLHREIHFMGKAELFKNPLFGWLIKHLNCFPVNRGAGDENAVNFASIVLQKDMALGIFPEGTRSKEEDRSPAKRPKSGVAMLAQLEKSDVLPVSVYCEGKVKPFKKYTVRVGKVIKYEELGFTEEGSRSEIRNASNYIWNKITALWSEGHAD